MFSFWWISIYCAEIHLETSLLKWFFMFNCKNYMPSFCVCHCLCCTQEAKLVLDSSKRLLFHRTATKITVKWLQASCVTLLLSKKNTVY